MLRYFTITSSYHMNACFIAIVVVHEGHGVIPQRRWIELRSVSLKFSPFSLAMNCHYLALVSYLTCLFVIMMIKLF